MEAQRLYNESGESFGVLVDASEYERYLEAREQLERANREIELIEGALLEVVDSMAAQGTYEHYVEHMEEMFREIGESPERASKRAEMMEELEARRALKSDIEEDEGDFVPWEEVEKSADAARASAE